MDAAPTGVSREEASCTKEVVVLRCQLQNQNSGMKLRISELNLSAPPTQTPGQKSSEEETKT